MKTQIYKNIESAAVKIGSSRQVVIPKSLHDSLGLKPGDYLEVEEKDGSVVMTPKTLIDKRVFLAFKESVNDLKRGRYSGPFNSAQEVTKSLHKKAK